MDQREIQELLKVLATWVFSMNATMTLTGDWGTGMIASSSTFCPHPGRVIRDLFRLLDAVTALYGSTSLQQSSKGSCSLLVSGYNLRADCQWRTLVPPLNSGANAAPASVLALM